jgi:hypothetical protein
MSTTDLSDIATINDSGSMIDLTNDALALGTSSTPRLTIASNGQVTVGAAAAASTTLFINGSTAAAYGTVANTAGHLSLDLSTANSFIVHLTGSAILDNPHNATAGQSGIIILTQPPTTTAGLSYGTSWRFPNGIRPTTTALSNAVDAISYMVTTGGANAVVIAQFISNFS